MCDKYKDPEQRAAVIELIGDWNAANDTIDGEPELGQEPADDGSDLVSHLRLGWVSERYMKATSDLILSMLEGGYLLFPGGGVFHAGNLYLVFPDEANESDRDNEWSVPFGPPPDGYVYRLHVMPQENFHNIDIPPVVFV